MQEIHDIFSKSKYRSEPKPSIKIIIDHREKNSLVPAKLIKLGFKIELKELKVADYLVGETAIERKEAKDFVSSMINKRLVRQLKELKQYKKRLLIVEGYIYASNINHNAINGFILSILTHYKTPIFFTKNEEETANIIKILANKKRKLSSLNPTKKIMNSKKRARFILESFEGIGPKTAISLLEKYGSLKEIFNSEEIKNIKGLNILEKSYSNKSS